jgi:hypothetical protein
MKLKEQWLNNFWVYKGMLDRYPLFEPKPDQSYTVERDGVGLVARNLFQWTKIQKQAFSQKKLTQEQMDFLEFLDLDWSAAPKTSVDQWETCLKVYNKIRLQDRHFEPVAGLVYDAEIFGNTVKVKNLAQWCHQNRVLFQKNKIPADRLQKLKSVCFAFENENSNTRDYAWAHNFKVYAHLKAKSPNFKPVKRKIYTVTIKGEKLSSNVTLWIDTQRMMKRKNKISQAKIETLDGIQFAWSVDPKHKRYDYPEMVALLLEYYNKNGLPSKSVKYKSRPLGEWTKRTAGFLNVKKEAQFLSEKALIQLEPAMHIFNLYSQSFLGGRYSWERTLNLYSQFRLKDTKFKPLKNKIYKAKVGEVVQSANLKVWVINQRLSYRNRKLDRDQVQKLKALRVI